ncbi:MAG: rhomboid family intramembrane serine protease, partial [Bacilli bacterium]|nr:rhomboid family intramembrane serine protease [Bacilli bacterium]
MENIVIRDKDEITMKLLHFFITREGYTPIIVHGAQDEIWLENMQAPYPIVRIMSGHIHNREQLEFDLYKASNLISRIKRKTFRFKVKALSIFLDIEENVELDSDRGIDCINLISTDDLQKPNLVREAFPNITSELMSGESGLELFVKITEEINATTEREAKKTEDVFKEKTPYITIMLIGLNIFIFILSLMYGVEAIGTYGGLYAPAVRAGEFYRLLTSTFIHAGALHLFFNMYALYIIGSQLE